MTRYVDLGSLLLQVEGLVWVQATRRTDLMWLHAESSPWVHTFRSRAARDRAYFTLARVLRERADKETLS